MQTTKERLLTSLVGIGMGRYTPSYIAPRPLVCVNVTALSVLIDCYETQLLASGPATVQCI